MRLRDQHTQPEPLPKAACCSYCVVNDEVERYSHGGDVFTGEGIGGVADQQTGLTHSPEEEEEEGEQTTSSGTELLCFHLH